MCGGWKRRSQFEGDAVVIPYAGRSFVLAGDDVVLVALSQEFWGSEHGEHAALCIAQGPVHHPRIQSVHAVFPIVGCCSVEVLDVGKYPGVGSDDFVLEVVLEEAVHGRAGVVRWFDDPLERHVWIQDGVDVCYGHDEIQQAFAEPRSHIESLIEVGLFGWEYARADGAGTSGA